MGRTGAACLGLGSGSRQGSLQVTLNVGDWGDHAKWPRCPSPVPLKPNGICHKSGSRGTWEAQPRELQSRQAEGHRPCSGNKPCAKRCCLSIGLGLQKWASAAWRHTGTRNCSEISLWTCGERTVEKSLAPAQWASQGAWVAGRACLPAVQVLTQTDGRRPPSPAGSARLGLGREGLDVLSCLQTFSKALLKSAPPFTL